MNVEELDRLIGRVCGVSYRRASYTHKEVLKIAKAVENLRPTLSDVEIGAVVDAALVSFESKIGKPALVRVGPGWRAIPAEYLGPFTREVVEHGCHGPPRPAKRDLTEPALARIIRDAGHNADWRVKHSLEDVCKILRHALVCVDAGDSVVETLTCRVAELEHGAELAEVSEQRDALARSCEIARQERDAARRHGDDLGSELAAAKLEIKRLREARDAWSRERAQLVDDRARIADESDARGDELVELREQLAKQRSTTDNLAHALERERSRICRQQSKLARAGRHHSAAVEARDAALVRVAKLEHGITQRDRKIQTLETAVNARGELLDRAHDRLAAERSRGRRAEAGRQKLRARCAELGEMLAELSEAAHTDPLGSLLTLACLTGIARAVGLLGEGEVLDPDHADVVSEIPGAVRDLVALKDDIKQRYEWALERERRRSEEMAAGTNAAVKRADELLELVRHLSRVFDAMIAAVERGDLNTGRGAQQVVDIMRAAGRRVAEALS